MTKRERKALDEYVRRVADQLELRDWTVELLRDPCEDGSIATVSITYGRKRAQIQVCEGFRRRTPAEQRAAVAHELVHCHLESACNMVRNDLEEHLGAQADKVFWTAFKRQVEYGVDALADALAKHLPLIAWPEARR